MDIKHKPGSIKDRLGRIYRYTQVVATFHRHIVARADILELQDILVLLQKILNDEDRIQ